MSAIDTYISYRLIRIITTPWKDQKAYKVGILDENGKTIIKRADLTKVQKEIYNPFYRMGINIKRVIEKIPGGKTKIGTYASALWLLKEVLHNDRIDFIDEEITNLTAGSPDSGVPKEEGSLKKKKKKVLTKKGKDDIMKENKLLETIKDIALTSNDETIDEKVIRVIRNRKKVKLKRPSVRKKGYKSVDGKNTRMGAKEKLNRKKAQKKGARKRRVKAKISNIKRGKSLKKRTSSMGSSR